MTNLIATESRCSLTEAEAIGQAKQGVAAAFEYLYQAHCRRGYNLCLRMIKNPTEAEDFTQQVFLQPFRKISPFRCESRFLYWLHRMTFKIDFIYLRRRTTAG